MLRDQSDQYAAAWSTFQQLDRVAPHRADWAAWADGRGPHTLLMALVEDRLAVEGIREVQRHFRALDGIELHAPHFLHVSLQTCGFGDELAVDVDCLARAVRAVPCFEVVLGGVNAFHSALILEAHSGGRLLHLRQALRGALGPRVRAIDPFDGFLFHLTLGYFGAEAQVERVRERVRPLRDADVVRVHIREVALVRLPTDQREAFPMLDCVARMALGAA